MWNKIIYTQRILLKKMSLWQKAFGGLNHCTLSVISQGLLVMRFYIWSLEESKNNYVSLQSRYFTYCYWIEGGELNLGFLHLSVGPHPLSVGPLLVKVRRQHFISALWLCDFIIWCLIYKPRRKTSFFRWENENWWTRDNIARRVLNQPLSQRHLA